MLGRSNGVIVGVFAALSLMAPALGLAQGRAVQPAGPSLNAPIAGPNAVPATPTGAPEEMPGGPSANALGPVASPDYRLGAGDKIRIIVYGEPELTGEFFVSGTGLVSFPLIGDVKAASLSIQEFQNELRTALKQGYLKEPRVSVEVLTYRPFYILGEVNKPGEYPYSNGLNVLNAVATAGGFTYRAQTKRVYVRRVGQTKEQVMPMAAGTLVAPGDTIRVVERFF